MRHSGHSTLIKKTENCVKDKLVGEQRIVLRPLKHKIQQLGEHLSQTSQLSTHHCHLVLLRRLGVPGYMWAPRGHAEEHEQKAWLHI